MMAFFGVLILTSMAGIYLVDFREMFGIDVPRPQDDTPFYFIQNDYVKGLLALVGLLPSLGLVVFLMRRKHELTAFIAAFSLLYYGAKVTVLISIHFRCPNVFTPESSLCTWSSFDSYIADPLHVSSELFFLTVPILLLLGWGGTKVRAVLREKGSRAA